MQGHETSPGGHKIQERLLLLRADLGGVGKNEQTIVTTQIGAVQVFHLVGVNQVDVPGGKDRLELLEPIGRTMMPVIAEK